MGASIFYTAIPSIRSGRKKSGHYSSLDQYNKDFHRAVIVTHTTRKKLRYFTLHSPNNGLL